MLRSYRTLGAAVGGSTVFLGAGASMCQSSTSTKGASPIVLVGPSGSGKGTLVARLMENHPDKFGFCVSHTTRPPRPGEVDGINYHYTSREAILKEIDAGKFLEYADVHGKIYGTSFKSVQDVGATGKICIIEIDIQGAESVRASELEPYYLFIQPPSMEVLEKRLRGRGTESEEQVSMRIKTAKDEMVYGATPGKFDAVVLNDDLEKAYADLCKQLYIWYPHLA